MAFGDSDLSVFFGDFGVTVQFGAQPEALGNLDEPEVVNLADQGFGGIRAIQPQLRLPKNAFSPMPQELDHLVVDSSTYEVTEVTGEGDGAISIFHLKGPIA